MSGLSFLQQCISMQPFCSANTVQHLLVCADLITFVHHFLYSNTGQARSVTFHFSLARTPGLSPASCSAFCCCLIQVTALQVPGGAPTPQPPSTQWGQQSLSSLICWIQPGEKSLSTGSSQNRNYFLPYDSSGINRKHHVGSLHWAVVIFFS